MLQSVSSRGNDNATERVELGEDDVSLCYQRFGHDLITHDLLPHQKKDKKYCLRKDFKGDTRLSTFQRSFLDNMLRKALGEKRLALHIWQNGLPSIVDPPAEYDLGMLQSSLYECLRWYIAFANDIVAYQTQSSLDEEEQQRQQTRREALQKARDALRRGATLAKERDQGKRTFNDMDDAEQKMLEDYETGRATKAKKQYTAPMSKPFRCKLQIND